jgi:hypothetical protein
MRAAYNKIRCFDVELMFLLLAFTQASWNPQGTAVRSMDLSLADSDSIYNGLISCARLFVNESVACDRDLYILEDSTRSYPTVTA